MGHCPRPGGPPPVFPHRHRFSSTLLNVEKCVPVIHINTRRSVFALASTFVAIRREKAERVKNPVGRHGWGILQMMTTTTVDYRAVETPGLSYLCHAALISLERKDYEKVASLVQSQAWSYTPWYERWCFQSIKQPPRGAAARHPGRLKDSLFSSPTLFISRRQLLFLSSPVILNAGIAVEE